MIRATPTLLTNKLILGVDPGTTIMGFALIEVTGSKVKVLTYDTINLKRVTNHAVKLKRIYDGTIELINQYLPDEMAIEAQFYSNNVQSMLKLGRAQGVAIAAALSRDIPYVEYAPKRIKQSITGNGNASKEQVAHMLGQILKLTDVPKLFDATDALAVALCHHYQKGVNTQAGTKSWKSFLTDNPDRIK
ncbi:crossover junction endodeoxyribonuclease RuvC [Adhaeribacter rhizoryzae]|uniref:Crossover junction endodeoxyribonuclease RuvC n=1 Tax=Adhaeribacter rhizoryzae TaxID=2607907 RepID=A0A5M6DNZ0_9BACT|nr:crossover junction endodeoxyribonuclease RuvC [Adhaeribacter rhizoryzae]KAA5548146.1 crossover junction endodeoxyribonuclease RuvC [Adhaeribacter rhizoryzae]